MSTITREKNLIKVLLDGKTAPYIFDINTGVVYGIRGKAVKTVNKEVFRGFCPYRPKTELQRVIYALTDDKCSMVGALQRNSAMLRLADSFDNLGITADCSTYVRLWHYTDFYADFLKDKNLCKQYIKYAQDSIKAGEQYSYRGFKEYRREQTAKERLGFDFDEKRFEVIRSDLINLTEWATDRQIKSFIVNFVETDYYLTVDRYDHKIWQTPFRNYCQYCEFLNEKVTTKPNFLSEFPRIYKAYQAQKAEIDAKRFKKAIDLHRTEMEFEYGDLKVVIPNSPQDIKDEGKNMHHCVASYAEYCMAMDNPNRSYIVFIRHKDTPEKCYITCEIRNGVIHQCYLAYDRHLFEATDREFKQRYQEHLNTHWTKEH